MNPERWRQIEQLYDSVLKVDSDRREAYLVEACGGDDSLRKEVEQLLLCQPRIERFLEPPAFEVAAKALAMQTRSEPAANMLGHTIAQYQILEEIGSGGMGVVYKAYDTRLKRPVAIKMLPDHFLSDPGRKARFAREARLLATLNYPAIAAIHDYDESDGRPFLVLELVEGETLAEKLKRGRLPQHDAVDVCRQIAEGLEAAHASGVIHRDLKPSNVKLTPEGKVKILDFGLAKVLSQPPLAPRDPEAGIDESDQSASGVVLGTAPYMSPEQASGKPVDKRTDVGPRLHPVRVSGRQGAVSRQQRHRDPGRRDAG